MPAIFAEQALTSDGWQRDVLVEIGADGRIAGVGAGAAPDGTRVGILLPAPANLHSHAFQRALAGLTERPGPEGRDSFWTWRALMYRFVAWLTPDDVEAITAFAQVEMLEAGYAAVSEFHYLHHQVDGAPYSDPAEMSARVAAAASGTGIGLTLLPVLYQVAACDGRPLAPEQARFGNTPDSFAGLVDRARAALAALPDDSRVGIGAHSLRAVTPEGLADAVALAGDGPIHLHAAEQQAEVDEVLAARGARPVRWVLDNAPVDGRWCLVHATQMVPEETAALAASGAVAGLCPVTEASLGDGIFDGVAYLGHGGRFGVGTDSNIRISLAEELRTLEYSQRLRDRGRALLAADGASAGRTLFARAARGGAQAAGRDTGAIAPGLWGDLLALDAEAVDIAGLSEDTVLDAFVFARGDAAITDVWSAGRHMVRQGRHVGREAIERRFLTVLKRLQASL